LGNINSNIKGRTDKYKVLSAFEGAHHAMPQYKSTFEGEKNAANILKSGLS